MRPCVQILCGFKRTHDRQRGEEPECGAERLVNDIMSKTNRYKDVSGSVIGLFFRASALCRNSTFL